MDILSEPQVSVEIGGVKTSYWADVWRHRELLYTLTWRDLLARYKQTALGASWTFVRPLLMMVIFTFVTRAARFPTYGAPPAIFVWAGLLPWQFFAFGIVETSPSIVINGAIVSKIYFPRILVPVSAVAMCFCDFFFSLLLLVLFSICMRFVPGSNIWAFPFFVVLLFGFVVGIGVFFSALTVKYRDLRLILPMLVQIGVYATPVFYPQEVVNRVIPLKFMSLYDLNPMVGIIEGFRWSIVGRQAHIDEFALIVSVVETLLILVLGLRYFARVDMTFADNL